MAQFAVPFEIVGQVIVEADNEEEATRRVTWQACMRAGDLTTYEPTNIDELAEKMRRAKEKSNA